MIQPTEKKKNKENKRKKEKQKKKKKERQNHKERKKENLLFLSFLSQVITKKEIKERSSKFVSHRPYLSLIPSSRAQVYSYPSCSLILISIL